MQPAPIAFFPYKRKDLSELTINHLLKNKLAKDTDLIIFADGPKTEKDVEKVENVRHYLKTISGFKSIELNFSEKNKGLANSIIKGVNSVLDKYGKVIVIEDDIVVNENFLEFMNLALEKYQNNEKVCCINGYQFPLKKTNHLPDTFFLKGAECWGWGTWQRAWQDVEWDGKKLLKEIRAKDLQKEIDFNNNYPFVKMLEDQINGRNNSWAIRWYISSFLKNRLCLYPKKTLVQNIGFESIDGSHCIGKKTGKEVTINLENHLPSLTDKIEINVDGYNEIAKFHKKSKINLIRKIFNKLYRVFESYKKICIRS